MRESLGGGLPAGSPRGTSWRSDGDKDRAAEARASEVHDRVPFDIGDAARRQERSLKRNAHRYATECWKAGENLMFTLKWLPARGMCRGKPSRRFAMIGLLVVSSLLETGCQSGPFSPCGFVGRTTAWVTRPFRSNRASVCCGPAVVSDGGCFPSAVPVETIGAPVIAPVVPGTTPSNVAPADTPSNLEPLPQAEPGPAQSIRRAPSDTGAKAKSSYETLRPETRSGRSSHNNLARSLASAPVPAVRPAQSPSGGIVRDAAATASTRESDSILDHMPPLDLPAEATEKIVTPPVAPSVERKPEIQPAAAAPASGHLTGRSVREPEVNLTATAQPAPEPAPAAGGTPGLARFVAVDLKLAGGSKPSAEGLDWLADKGYKTLIDLREPSEVGPDFIDEAMKRGLRYLPLPITSKTIDRVHVDRFNLELASSDARPLYFFDADGSRAAALWYIRRITVDSVDKQIAHREAEELGLGNSEPALAATRYLEQLESRRDQLSSQGPKAPAPTTEPNPSKPAAQVSPAASDTSESARAG